MPLFGRKSKDRAPGGKAHLLELMTRHLPKCPLCGAEAEYDVKGSRKVQCNSCKAQWGSNNLRRDKDLKYLKLIRSGKGSRIIKPLRYRLKTTEYWQNFTVQKYQESLKEDKAEVFRITELVQDSENLQDDYAKLKAAGDLGLCVVRGIADGITYLPQYRSWALSALAVIGDERDYGIFMRAYEDDELAWQMDYVFFSLYKQTGKDEFWPPLYRILTSAPRVKTRAKTAQRLGEIIGDKRVVDALVEALDDYVHPEQKVELITAGSTVDLIRQSVRMRPPKATEPIVHQAAVEALIKIGEPQAMEALILYEVSRSTGPSYEFSKSIDSLGPIAVDALLNLLGTSNVDHMRGIISLLGHTKDPRAVEPLIELLQHENPRVRRYSAIDLRSFSDSRIPEALNLALDDQDDKVREYAKKSLESIARRASWGI